MVIMAPEDSAARLRPYRRGKVKNGAGEGERIRDLCLQSPGYSEVGWKRQYLGGA